MDGGRGRVAPAASEHLSELLSAQGLVHQVLNARQDQEEAEIVARAGERGRITVATNMAGRGTDIRIAPDVAAIGGLHVLATERHDAGRIDRQLFGRCGRQGDPGSFQVIVSLEDEIVQDYYKGRAPRAAGLLRLGGRALPRRIGEWIVGAAQRGAERHHGRARRELLQIDEQLSDMLAFTGRSE
jgi:preprotein translocase subunit SecA